MRFRRVRLIAAIVAAGAAWSLPASAASVLGFRTNFETGLYSHFSGEADLAPLAKINGAASGKLGKLLHNDSGGAKTRATTLTLSNLPSHSSIDLDLLLAVIGQWEKGSGASADKFNVHVDGKPVFAKAMAGHGSKSAAPGAAKTLDMGQFASLANIPHTSANLRIDFFATGNGWKGGLDESWAIDDVTIMINGVSGIDDCFPIPVPLPASAQAGFCGLAAVVGLGMLRRRSLHPRA